MNKYLIRIFTKSPEYIFVFWKLSPRLEIRTVAGYSRKERLSYFLVELGLTKH